MARFTEHQGDPAWLKSQRDAQARHRPKATAKVYHAMPYPSQAPPVAPVSADRSEFVHGASSSSSAAAFVLGFIAVRRALKGRQR